MNEEKSFYILTVLIKILFPDYFSNGMKGLLTDLEVFHIMFVCCMPSLYFHLKSLSEDPSDPPIINPFVSSWVSSLFSQMLSHDKLLRLWDSILIEGTEMLLRHSLAIFFLMERDLLKIRTPLEFYTIMSSLPQLLQDVNCPLFPGYSLLQVNFSFPFFFFFSLRK